MTSAAKRRDQRIELRATEEEKFLISEAASQVGTDVTGFILERVLPDARRVVAERDRIKATAEDLRFIIELLENPPPPSPALIEAGWWWKARVG